MLRNRGHLKEWRQIIECNKEIKSNIVIKVIIIIIINFI